MDYKKVAILMTGLVMVLGTTTAFAVWDDLNESVSDNTIEIGQGLRVTVAEAVVGSEWLGAANRQLVPNDDNVVMKTGDVKLATKTFNVSYTQLGSIEPGDYIVDVIYEDLAIYDVGEDEPTTPAAGTLDLITIQISWSENNFLDEDGTPGPDEADAFNDNVLDFYDGSDDFLPDLATVTYYKVDVTLAVPTNDNQYNSIVGKEIRFNLTFEAAVNPRL